MVIYLKMERSLICVYMHKKMYNLRNQHLLVTINITYNFLKHSSTNQGVIIGKLLNFLILNLLITKIGVITPVCTEGSKDLCHTLSMVRDKELSNNVYFYLTKAYLVLTIPKNKVLSARTEAP